MKYLMLLLLVSGCAHYQPAEEAITEADLNASFDSYSQCMIANVNRLYKSTELPSEIAMACQGNCGGEFAEYSNDFREFMSSQMQTGRGHALAQRKSDTEVNKVKESVMQRVQAMVLELRMKTKRE